MEIDKKQQEKKEGFNQTSRVILLDDFYVDSESRKSLINCKNTMGNLIDGVFTPDINIAYSFKLNSDQYETKK